MPPGDDDDDKAVIEDVQPPAMDAIKPDKLVPVDDDVELPGVDMLGNEDPPIIAADDDLNVAEPNPAPIELENPIIVETVNEAEPETAPEEGLHRLTCI